MFTGIIEAQATIKQIEIQGTNRRINLESPMTSLLQIDQSLSHNGVCLTVVQLSEKQYSVDVVQESLERTTIKYWAVGDLVNLERSMTMDKLFDGHIVQGHVDKTIRCVNKVNQQGSWEFTFEYPSEDFALLIPKGSICINGVSLTIADLTDSTFSVAIIPYTYEYTNFNRLSINDEVNIEYDVIGKYLNRIEASRR